MPVLAAFTTVLLIRHAERGAGADPHLTVAGRARAKTLIHVLGEAGIRAIYRSQFNRSKETAKPIAQSLGLVPFEIDEAAELKEHILTNQLGRTVLVIGHSDTVPSLIRLLGAGTVPAIEDDEFDNLYVLKRINAGSRVTRLKYGKPS